MAGWKHFRQFTGRAYTAGWKSFCQFASCVLKSKADYQAIRIEGHVSARLADGTERSETRALALSDRLARRVKTALEQAGLNPKKLKANGFGAVRPACTEKTTSCNVANQRVELVFE